MNRVCVVAVCLFLASCGGEEAPAPKEKSAFERSPSASPIRTGRELQRQIGEQNKLSRDRRKQAESIFEDR